QTVATPAKIRLNSALTATAPVTSSTCSPRGGVHGIAGGQHRAERTTARTRDPCPPHSAWLRLHERGQRGTATRHGRARSVQTQRDEWTPSSGLFSKSILHERGDIRRTPTRHRLAPCP